MLLHLHIGLAAYTFVFSKTNHVFIRLMSESATETHLNIKIQDGNSQNFFGNFVRFFVTLKCLYIVVIHKKIS